MRARIIAAPPTPWSQGLVEPSIASTAYVHAFSKIVGDVRVKDNVLIAPSTSIRADEGAPFHIGENSNIQDGVVIHGLAEGRVLGDDGENYSVWIGGNTSITHKALVHGPAYVGDNCFIGFRSTVFNARVNPGCIVMMHALIQDVEIPPGKYVPSGSVITNQQQADRLPDIQPEDLHFTQEVIGVNEALRTGYQCLTDESCVGSIRQQQLSGQQQVVPEPASGLQVSNQANSRNDKSTSNGERSGLSMDIQEQVRQLLAQGYRVSTEHTDARRFRTQTWSSCSPIESTNPGQVLSALTACCQEHSGEYVRILGVDTQQKRRVFEAIVQRPGQDLSLSTSNYSGSSSSSFSYSGSRASTPAAVKASGSVSDTVRQLVSQGLSIGVEVADKRHFRAKSWTSAGLFDARNAAEATRSLQACLSEYQGYYVRLLGVDTRAKKRVFEEIIQRPGEAVVSGGSVSSSSYSSYSSSLSSSASSSASLSSDVVSQVRQALSQGYRIGTEHADKRRFRTKSWQSCGLIDATSESGVIAALEACMQEHAGEYVRVLVVDTKAKRRISEAIIQRPGQSVSPSPVVAPSSSSSSSNGNGRYSRSNGNSSSSHGQGLSSELRQQIQQLLSQGYDIGLEYADKRRFRAKSWQSVSVGREAVSGVAACIQEHPSDYVKLIGIDTKAKRRVFEEIVYRPN